MAFPFFGFRYELKQKASLSFKAFWNYIPNRWYFFTFIILEILIWFFSYHIFAMIGSDLFVSHYNVNFGIDGVGEAKRVFNIAFFILIFSLINLFFLLNFRGKNVFNFMAHATGLTIILLHVLAALALMALYLTNFIA